MSRPTREGGILIIFQRVEFFSLFNFILKIGKKSPYIKISFLFFANKLEVFQMRPETIPNKLLWPNSNKCTFVNTFQHLINTIVFGFFISHWVSIIKDIPADSSLI